MPEDQSKPPEVSAIEISKAAERSRDECNRAMERQRYDVTVGRPPPEARPDRVVRVSIQRRRHLKLLELYIRRTLHEAYPQGPPHGNASWLLSNGNELVAALERVEQGVYGVCVECGREISLLRLWAQPEARRCQRCQPDRCGSEERHWHFVI